MTTETLMTDGAQTTDAAASQAASTTPADTPAADAAATGTAPAEGAKPEAAKEPEAKPQGAPEKYELKLDEGALTADEVAGVETLAKSLGLSQEQAQKLAEQRATDKAAAQDAVKQQVADLRAGWVAEIKADKELGGDKLPETLAVASKVLKDYDKSGEVTAWLNASGMGDSPMAIRFFHSIGKALSEDRFVPSTGSNGQPASRDPAAVLYPNQ